jgi:hypothetical protein
MQTAKQARKRALNGPLFSFRVQRFFFAPKPGKAAFPDPQSAARAELNFNLNLIMKSYNSSNNLVYGVNKTKSKYWPRTLDLRSDVCQTALANTMKRSKEAVTRSRELIVMSKDMLKRIDKGRKINKSRNF